jgi:hypothetical protein
MLELNQPDVLFPKQETPLESDLLCGSSHARALVGSEGFEPLLGAGLTCPTRGTFASTGKNRLLCQLSYEPKRTSYV